jgi:aspartyl protease family protein
MAQRPLIWALGMAGAALYLSLSYSEKLASWTDSSDAPRAAAATARAASGTAKALERPSLAVAADFRGHYMVHPTIDNYRIRMMVDTGATLVALTAADAKALGLQPRPADYKVGLNTANGVVKAARVLLREIRLGDILVRNVEAVVLPAGALSMSLLGTSFLGKLRGYEVQTGRMVLRG